VNNLNVASLVFAWVFAIGEVLANPFVVCREVRVDVPPQTFHDPFAGSNAVADNRTDVAPTRPDYSKGITDYAALARGTKTVFVWVAYRCPSSASQVVGVHRHCDNYLGITRPCVVVLKPRNGTELVRERVIEAKDCCASSLANALNPDFGAPRGGA
jgi:hypothetical protein